MAFFGLPERELPHNLLNDNDVPHEDLAVYTWGDGSYDGLGDALQEARDDLNDETFGGSGPVGKDFDFSTTGLIDQPSQPAPDIQRQLDSEQPLSKPAQTASASALDSLWHNQSAFSVLPRTNGASRVAAADQPRASPGIGSQYPQQRFSSPLAANSSPLVGHQTQLRGRSLQDIEGEMLANAQRERLRDREREEQLLQQEIRQELLHQQQERMLQQERLMQQERLIQQQQQQLLQQQQLQRLREEEARRILYQQQEQAQLQRLLLHQREQLQQQRTPPPRMLPTSQSPRFHEHHQRQQILLLQQQQREDLQQQQRMLQLEEQLRLEELDRQIMAMQLERGGGRGESPSLQHNGYGRRISYTPAELQEAQLMQQAHERQLLLQQQQQQHRRQSSRSPALAMQHQDGFQLQQRLLAELAAHGELPRELQGLPHPEQEALRAEAMRKIVEAERMEEKRRRKAAKIAHMARYNDLMTQSDKDFITRIQVSQLVTQDPYADDFYAQVYGAILRSRMGLQSQDERVLKFGSGGGIGLGLASKGGGRRPSAMQRMEQQVERIVSNARKREEEKGLHALHSLQGALGKTSGRSYKAAPRQLLQVEAGAAPSPTLSHATATAHISRDSAQHEGAAKEAAKLGREALGDHADTNNLVKKDPLTHRQSLVILEELYDRVLQVESLRRDQPSAEDELATVQWVQEYDACVDKLWEELRVLVPLETSDPHPFISLLTPTKGKKILPRLTRHLSNQRMLTLLTLLVACFEQLDVVRNAAILDDARESIEKADVDRQTQAFLSSVMQSILPVVLVANLRLVTGLLGLLLHRSDIVAIARTKPGLALLTLFLSRVEVIKQNLTTPDAPDAPTVEEGQQWAIIFEHLFQLLAPHLLSLFPSCRIANSDPNQPLLTDSMDQPVWQFLAAVALHGGPEEHHVLVASLREKILDNVLSVNKGWVHDEEQRRQKLGNVNLFLHAVNLDSSQITM